MLVLELHSPDPRVVFVVVALMRNFFFKSARSCSNSQITFNKNKNLRGVILKRLVVL